MKLFTTTQLGRISEWFLKESNSTTQWMCYCVWNYCKHSIYDMFSLKHNFKAIYTFHNQSKTSITIHNYSWPKYTHVLNSVVQNHMSKMLDIQSACNKIQDSNDNFVEFEIILLLATMSSRVIHNFKAIYTFTDYESLGYWWILLLS